MAGTTTSSADTRRSYSRFWLIIKWIGLFTLPVILIVGALGLKKYLNLKASLPPLDKLMARQYRSTQVYDRNGELIGELGGKEKRIPVKFAAIPKVAVNALVASEDQRFFEHGGVDYKGLLRAAWANLKTRRFNQGASTVTQQLVKGYILSSEKTLDRKFKEMLLARQVEEKYGKEDILELYFNKVCFGYNRCGIEAAANFYFGKHVGELTLSESSMLIGILPSPSVRSPLKNLPLALFYQKRVLNRMRIHRMITDAEYEMALKNPPKPVPYRSEEAQTGQEVLDEVRKYLERFFPKDEIDYLGFKVYTSIDLKVQAATRRALKQTVRTVAERNGSPYYPEGAVVSLDPERRIIALVGGADYVPGGQNRALRAWRQPGSTFKGMVYAAGFEAGKFNPDSEFPNVVISYADIGGPWTPKNYRGEASEIPTFLALSAFAHSLNTIAARAICGLWPGTELEPPYSVKGCREYGLVHETIALAEKAGIKWNPLDRPSNNPSIALGSNGVTPIGMLGAYMAVAFDGEYIEPTLIIKIVGENAPPITDPERRRVVGEQTLAWMQKLTRAVIEEGTGRAAFGKLPETAYGKTGTTNESTNAWFVGGTRSYWTGVWIGYKNQSMSLGRNETGARTALPLWLATELALYGRESNAVAAMRRTRDESAEVVDATEEVADQVASEPLVGVSPSTEERSGGAIAPVEDPYETYEGSGTVVPQ